MNAAKNIAKIFCLLALVTFLSSVLVQPTYAATKWGLLPATDTPTGNPGKLSFGQNGEVTGTEIPPQGCFEKMYQYEQHTLTLEGENKTEILACAIKTGKIHPEFIPFYILHIANLLVFAAGLIAILFIIVGGYQYVLGGVTGNTEKGKKTIFYAVGGLTVVILSYFIVQAIQLALTPG